MRRSKLTLISQAVYNNAASFSLGETLSESLWDTVKNDSLHIILREPSLLELAQRKEPGVIPFCDILLTSEDQESWFSALKALETLNSYDAAQRLLILCGSSNTSDRKIVLDVLARILSAPQREGFRRLIRSFVVPGELDVSGWTPIALRVLEHVCIEKGIDLVNADGSLVDLDLLVVSTQTTEAMQSD